MSDKPLFGKANPPAGKKYDFADAKVSLNIRGFNISWAARGVGFGQMSFDVGPEGQVHIDTEYMSDQFVNELLEYLVSNSTKDSDPAPFKTSNEIFFEGHDAPEGTKNPYASEPECIIWQQGYKLGHE